MFGNEQKKIKRIRKALSMLKDAVMITTERSYYSSLSGNERIYTKDQEHVTQPKQSNGMSKITVYIHTDKVYGVRSETHYVPLDDSRNYFLCHLYLQIKSLI